MNLIFEIRTVYSKMNETTLTKLCVPHPQVPINNYIKET